MSKGNENGNKFSIYRNRRRTRLRREIENHKNPISFSGLRLAPLLLFSPGGHQWASEITQRGKQMTIRHASKWRISSNSSCYMGHITHRLTNNNVILPSKKKNSGWGKLIFKSWWNNESWRVKRRQAGESWWKVRGCFLIVTEVWISGEWLEERRQKRELIKINSLTR